MDLSKLTAKPVRPAQGEKDTEKLEFTTAAYETATQQFAFLQLRIDVVTNGQIRESWYCDEYAAVRFLKKGKADK